MTMSKKDMLVLGALGVGGVALASMIVEKEEETQVFGGGGFPIGGAIAPPITAEPAAQPIIYQFPESGFAGFPEAPTSKFDMSKIVAPVSTSIKTISVPVADVNKVTKKWRETGKIGFGYEGYVTPITPTPITGADEPPSVTPDVSWWQTYVLGMFGTEEERERGKAYSKKKSAWSRVKEKIVKKKRRAYTKKEEEQIFESIHGKKGKPKDSKPVYRGGIIS